MRVLRALIAIVFLAAGILLGALNPELSIVDLGVVRVEAGLGVILLCTLLIGVLAGGFAISVSIVLPLRSQLRRSQTVEPLPQEAAAPVPAPVSAPAAPLET